MRSDHFVDRTQITNQKKKKLPIFTVEIMWKEESREIHRRHIGQVQDDKIFSSLFLVGLGRIGCLQLQVHPHFSSKHEAALVRASSRTTLLF